jgi:hypothetical protein
MGKPCGCFLWLHSLYHQLLDLSHRWNGFHGRPSIFGGQGGVRRVCIVYLIDLQLTCIFFLSASYAPLIFGLMMFLRVMMGACYVWWYDNTGEYNVARHYGYLGSLAKIYYSRVSASPDGSSIEICDVQSISAGSSSTYIGNSTGSLSVHHALDSHFLICSSCVRL